MENDYFFFTPQEMAKERQNARDLRKSRWWKDKLARGLCEYCGGQFPPETLTMDHILPLAKGGKSVKNNLVCACKECNNSKKNMLPWQWEAYLEEKKK